MRPCWCASEPTWPTREQALIAEGHAATAPGFREVVGPDLSAVEFFVDFDGVLAPIVDEPSDAVATPGVIDALDRIREDVGAVTIVSGRSVEFLRTIFSGSNFSLVGVYGIETLVDDVVVVDPRAEPWAEVIGSAAEAARGSGIVGMDVEHKRLSLTLHYRGRPEIADSVTSWAQSQSAKTGLEARPARQAVELHPRVDIDKGAAILARVGKGARTVVYIGDDVGDLAAFDALDDLERRGAAVARVAVASNEAPRELLDRADIVLENTAAVLSFLET